MHQPRPVFLNLFAIKFPITAITSILHRVSGVILFFSIPILLYFLDLSLTSEFHFDLAKSYIQSIFGKLIVWAILSFITYHLFAGIRHIIMDCGIGESKEAGSLSSKILLIVSVIAILLIGFWIW